MILQWEPNRGAMMVDWHAMGTAMWTDMTHHERSHIVHPNEVVLWCRFLESLLQTVVATGPVKWNYRKDLPSQATTRACIAKRRTPHVLDTRRCRTVHVTYVYAWYVYSPWLVQIARELQQRLPGVLGGMVISNIWAYKFDSDTR